MRRRIGREGGAGLQACIQPLSCGWASALGNVMGEPANFVAPRLAGCPEGILPSGASFTALQQNCRALLGLDGSETRPYTISRIPAAPEGATLRLFLQRKTRCSPRN